MTTPNWPARLIRLLTQQVALCEQLNELGVQQAEHVGAGQTDTLLHILGRRQGIVDQLTALGEELEPFRRDWSARIAELSQPERQELDATVSRLTSLIEQINERDERDRRTLEHRRARISEQMQDVRRGQSALSAYGNRSSGPMYQDRQG